MERSRNKAGDSADAEEQPLMSVSERVKLLNRRQSPPRDGGNEPVRQYPPTWGRAKYRKDKVGSEISPSVSATADDEDREDSVLSTRSQTAAATPLAGSTSFDIQTEESDSTLNETPLYPKKLTFVPPTKSSPSTILRSTGKVEKKFGGYVQSRRVVSFSDIERENSTEGAEEDKSRVSRLTSQFNKRPSPHQPIGGLSVRSHVGVEPRAVGLVVDPVSSPSSLASEDRMRDEVKEEQCSSTTSGPVHHFAARNPTFAMTTVSQKGFNEQGKVRVVSPMSSAADGTEKTQSTTSTRTNVSSNVDVSTGMVTQVQAADVDAALLPLAERVKLFDRRANLASHGVETAPSSAESDAGVPNCGVIAKVLPFSGCSAKTGSVRPQATALDLLEENKVCEQLNATHSKVFREKKVVKSGVTLPKAAGKPSDEADCVDAPDLIDITDEEGIDDYADECDVSALEAEDHPSASLWWVDFTSDNRSTDSRLSDLHSTDGDLWKKWNETAAVAAMSLVDAATHTSDADSIGAASEVTRDDVDSTFGRPLDTSEWSSRETIRRLAAVSKAARANAYAFSRNVPHAAPGGSTIIDHADGGNSVGASTASDFFCFDPEETSKHFAALSKVAASPTASRQQLQSQQRNLTAFVPYAPRPILDPSMPNQRTFNTINKRLYQSRMCEAGSQREEVPALTEAGSSSAESATSETSVNERVKLFDKARLARNTTQNHRSPRDSNVKTTSSDGSDTHQESLIEKRHSGSADASEQLSLKDRIRLFGGSKDPELSRHSGTSALHTLAEQKAEQPAGEASIGSTDRRENAAGPTKPSESLPPIAASAMKVDPSNITSTVASRRPPRVVDNSSRRGQITALPMPQKRKTTVISRVRLLDSGASVGSQSYGDGSRIGRFAEDPSVIDPTDESIELALAPSRAGTPVMSMEEQVNRRQSSTGGSMEAAVLQARNTELALADSEGDDTMGGCSADAVTTEQPSFSHSKSSQDREKKQGCKERGKTSLQDKIRKFGGGIATNETNITESSSSTSGGDAVFGSIESACSLSPTAARSASQLDGRRSQAVSAVEEEREVDEFQDSLNVLSPTSGGRKSSTHIRNHPHFRLWEEKTLKSAWV